LLTLPAAAAFIVLAQPIMTVLFERGRLRAGGGPRQRRRPSAPMPRGLPAFVLVKVLAPGFFSRITTPRRRSRSRSRR